MADKRTLSQDVEDNSRGPRSVRSPRDKPVQDPQTQSDLPAPLIADPGAILRDPEVAHPANVPLGARALTELQRQRGMICAQRLLRPKLSVNQP
ncbi:MAG: hypothetical protein PVJ55_05335, partial [Anaerolineae bacterium]